MQLSLFIIECFTVIQDFISYINSKMINDNLIINVDWHSLIYWGGALGIYIMNFLSKP